MMLLCFVRTLRHSKVNFQLNCTLDIISTRVSRHISIQTISQQGLTFNACCVFGFKRLERPITYFSVKICVMSTPRSHFQRNEVVFDVSTMKTRRKRVAPISRQLTHESRRVWRYVTAALRAVDTEAATAAKRLLEQTQRDAAKKRADSDEAWLTQVGQISNHYD